MGQALKEDKRFTYQDYLTWPDEEHWEIIEGEAWYMSPAPNIEHQDICGEVFVKFKNYLRLKGSTCKAYTAPTDVVFDDHNVVQPDVLVICDSSKIGDKNIQGAPDLIVEVLSPATAGKDRRTKRELYEKHGVKEYVLIDPPQQLVEVYRLIDGAYGKPDVVLWNEELVLHQGEMTIQLWEVFGLEAPGESEAEDQSP